MYFWICITFCLTIFLSLSSGAIFGCNKLSSNNFVQTDGKNFTVSAMAEIVKSEKMLQISITNVTFNGTSSYDPKDTSIGIIYRDFDEKEVYFSMYSNGILTTIENNSSFTLLARLPSLSAPMFDGVIDEFSFSPAFSGLFSKEKPCFVSDFDATQNICCLRFFEVPEAPNPYVPKCTQFKSQTILYDATDNYSIIASSQMLYNHSKNQITTIGSTNLPQYYGIVYKINGNDDAFGYCSSLNLPSLNCTYSIPEGGDMKILFTNKFFSTGNSNLPDVPLDKTAKLGRIILRNNLTLMEEGMPFTTKNNCIYNSDASAGRYVFYSQFCCQDFEN